MNPKDVVELVREQLWPMWKTERERLNDIDVWMRWAHPDPRLPRQMTPELKHLVELSKTPWLGLVVTTVAQAMYVDGYRSPTSGDNAGPWRTWLANDMDSRQVPIHRAALGYGVSYTLVLPGTADDGSSQSVIRGISPRKMIGVYADQAADDWPMFAMHVEASGGGWKITLYDEANRYHLWADKSGDKFTFISWEIHGASVCPVVRYANMLDLDGRTDGEVEPFIAVAGRINKTEFDRLLVQHYNSWKVRTIAGLSVPDSEEETNRAKLKLRHDDILVAEDPDTKFGTLPETSVDGLIKAGEHDVQTLAAVSQTPTFALTGDIVNLSADGIVAARAQFTHKVVERQKSFRKSHNQTLRLAALLEGDTASAQDVTAAVTWQDMDIRSMSQAVDALGKAATMLGVPPQALWGRIPGVEQADVEEWKGMASESDAMSTLLDTLNRHAAPSAGQ